MRRILIVPAVAFLTMTACTVGVQPDAAQSPNPRVSVADAYTPVVASTLGPPTLPVQGTDTKYHIVYDLELLNASRVPSTIQKIDVVDAANPSKIMVSYEGAALLERMRPLANGAPAQNAEIEPNGGRVVYVDFALDSLDNAPKTLLHHFTLLGASGPAAQQPTPINYTITPYAIPTGKPTVLGPPVTGKGWVALNGCCNPGFPHRSSFAPLNGQLINSQLFALDWKRMNDQGEFYTGDRNKNESYVDYGADVIAAAGGTVVATLDTEEPNAPGVLPAADPVRAAQLTVQNVDGNHIVVDHGNGTFAFYAHLQKGSLQVKKGDKVTRGQKLALLGNTGNSNAPHMHFHLMDGPSVLGSNGLPYVIDNFEYAGQVPLEVFDASDDFLTGKFNQQRLSDPQTRKDQLPLAFTIIDFPQ